MMMKTICKSSVAIALAALSACAPVANPRNIEPADSGGAYQAQYRDPVSVARNTVPDLLSPAMNAERCRPPREGALGKGSGYGALALSGERLSRGDLLDVRVAGDDTFTGRYEVSRDGTLRLPFLKPVQAQGRAVDAIESELADALVFDGFYSADVRVSVRVMDFAGVSVGVTGAVFEPRPVEIGIVPGDSVDDLRQEALGASTEGRDLANALRAAGGIRPDADLSAVELRRGGRSYVLDLRGVIEGRDRADVMMMTGDEIFVPSRGCFQDHLMVPSPISPPGVSLYLSNLTEPATGNALSAVGREVREVPYGTRFMQAVVDTNCVGGARATSAWRSAALFSRNPTNGISVVIERDIEAMLRRANRDDFDPYVLPGDAIACYDSTLTNVRDLAKFLGVVAVGIAVP
jgi:polysaccharide export outer membrane protein